MPDPVTSLSLTKEQFRAMLDDLGIEKGDVIYVAASLAAFYDWKEPEKEIVSILIEYIGDTGTLIMPAFNFGFCQGEDFSMIDTPSHSGRLSEYFRSFPGARRVLNTPFHSVVVYGALQDELSIINSSSSFGSQSIFTRLLEYDAKQLLIGCSFHDGVVHVHAVEERLGVPYRFWKKMEGIVYGEEGKSQQTFFMYARNRTMDPILDANIVGERFYDNGNAKSVSKGLLEMKSFFLKDLDRCLQKWITEDPWVLVSNKKLKYSSDDPSERIIHGIDHIGILSKYSEKINTIFQALGIYLSESGVVDELGVECSYYKTEGVRLELVVKNSDDSPLGEYMDRHSSHPIHHIAFKVKNITKAIEYFSNKLGVPQLDGRQFSGPRDGEVVTFLSPVFTGGLLIELVEIKPEKTMLIPDIQDMDNRSKERLPNG